MPKCDSEYQESILTQKKNQWLSWSNLLRHCFTLQHAAIHHNTLQHSSTHRLAWANPRSSWHCNILQQITTHCNTLQHAATHCNTLQHTATLCNSPPGEQIQGLLRQCNTLQNTTTHCSTRQHSATLRYTLQLTAWREQIQGSFQQRCLCIFCVNSTLHRTASLRTAPHHTAPHCNAL